MSVKTNTVNCWNAKSKDMPISSQASEESVEGSETRSWSPERTVKAHERSTPIRGEDIVPSSDESLSSRIKNWLIRFCYVSTYGELDVVLDRNMTTATDSDNAILGIDFNYAATPVLRATRDWPIGKKGDSDIRQILRESTIACLNTRAHFMVENIPNNLTVS